MENASQKREKRAGAYLGRFRWEWMRAVRSRGLRRLLATPAGQGGLAAGVLVFAVGTLIGSRSLYHLMNGGGWRAVDSELFAGAPPEPGAMVRSGSSRSSLDLVRAGKLFSGSASPEAGGLDRAENRPEAGAKSAHEDPSESGFLSQILARLTGGPGAGLGTGRGGTEPRGVSAEFFAPRGQGFGTDPGFGSGGRATAARAGVGSRASVLRADRRASRAAAPSGTSGTTFGSRQPMDFNTGVVSNPKGSTFLASVPSASPGAAPAGLGTGPIGGGGGSLPGSSVALGPRQPGTVAPDSSSGGVQPDPRAPSCPEGFDLRDGRCFERKRPGLPWCRPGESCWAECVRLASQAGGVQSVGAGGAASASGGSHAQAQLDICVRTARNNPVTVEACYNQFWSSSGQGSQGYGVDLENVAVGGKRCPRILPPAYGGGPYSPSDVPPLPFSPGANVTPWQSELDEAQGLYTQAFILGLIGVALMGVGAYLILGGISAPWGAVLLAIGGTMLGIALAQFSRAKGLGGEIGTGYGQSDQGRTIEDRADQGASDVQQGRGPRTFEEKMRAESERFTAQVEEVRQQYRDIQAKIDERADGRRQNLDQVIRRLWQLRQDRSAIAADPRLSPSDRQALLNDYDRRIGELERWIPQENKSIEDERSRGHEQAREWFRRRLEGAAREHVRKQDQIRSDLRKDYERELRPKPGEPGRNFWHGIQDWWEGLG